MQVLKLNMGVIKYGIATAIFFLILLVSADVVAQCPMCKAAAEASLNSDSKVNIALGLNKGIFYLFIMPYVLISAIFFIWYYNYRKQKIVSS